MDNVSTLQFVAAMVLVVANWVGLLCNRRRSQASNRMWSAMMRARLWYSPSRQPPLRQWARISASKKAPMNWRSRTF